MKSKNLIIGIVVGIILAVGTGGRVMAAEELTPIEKLGKYVFFDNISIPGNKQGCYSCHDPAKGGILPNSSINKTTVVAPGAVPHALGNIKPPPNNYASFSPPFRFGNFGRIPTWEGGNFWDGRAEGCGATGGPCPTANPAVNVSETITAGDIPLSKQPPAVPQGSADDYTKYLGPTADQALNPFPNAVEQNIREKNVCQRIKTAKYKKLYESAFGEVIDCSPDPQLPVEQRAYHNSFKLIALSLAAWQASTDLNSFSSRRKKAIECDSDGQFPLTADTLKCPDLSANELQRLTFTTQENFGHDLFYGRNDSGLNTGGTAGRPKAARCNACHNGVPEDETPNPDNRGVALRQLYTDNRYHHIGVPFNREIPGVAIGEKTGLNAHVTKNVDPTGVPTTDIGPGEFRTPTLLNVAKGVSGDFVKAYTHNGWFKSLESLVHFYNTRDVADIPNNALGLRRCEGLGIIDATEKEALQNNCWPVSEFPNPAVFIVGNLGLTFGVQVNNPNDPAEVKNNEEAALVAYMKTLSDELTPTKP